PYDFRTAARAFRRMNRRVAHLIAGWRTGLPRPVLILQAGNALNYFGYGLVLPFEIIYLHQIRGFSTSVAGLVLAATMGTAAIAAPPTGGLLDRYSAKAILVAGLLASALGYAGFAYVDSPWQAFACSIVSGAGIGATGTANRTLTIRLVKREQRTAAFARDRLFLTVIAANIVLVVVGHTFFSNILPPFAKAHTPLSPAAIGILFLVNTSFVVIAQIPAVRVVTRMRRTHAFAAASAIFAVSLLAVLPATLIHSELAATSLLAGVAIVFAIGECVHTNVLGPLVADMAPAHLLRRYLSLYSLTFTISLALGPAIGGLLLQTSPDA